MADVKDWGAFIRGRWDWHRFGYEQGFPRGCGFTDIDGAVEFDGKTLIIETKSYDGSGPLPDIPTGQRIFLRDEAWKGRTVYVLYGCGVCNDPYALRWISPTNASQDRVTRWKDADDNWLPREERRRLLKQAIDRAQGLRP